MHFFHYIPTVAVESAKSSGDWTWTSYRVSRPFVLLNVREAAGADAKKVEKGLEKYNDKGSPDLSDSKAIVFNPVAGIQFKVLKKQAFHLEDYFQPLDYRQKSKWMMWVNLETQEPLGKKRICQPIPADR